ncbi:MAG: hypothetical protein AB7L13_09045 [Acidimicrobiia bacterium]
MGFADEFQAMTNAGAALIVATAGTDGTPRAARAWSVTLVDAVANRLRVAVAADDPVVVENLRTGRIALTAADVRTLRSVQVKGRPLSIEEPSPADVAVTEKQSELLLAAIHETDGNPLDLLRRMLPHRVVMVEFAVDDRFDQTPGPCAGAPLGAEG